ncbi:MAG TPA: PIG-L deacetylase family protein [Actinomycetota bacterium]|nr:PIG-L deacetylase family protein [Actinomycetota bacterium]
MTEPDPKGPVLGVFAHPDDAEISAGGTMAKWADQGREVHLLILTNGDRGSNDPTQDRAALAATRAEETAAAAKVLGLAGTEILGVPDGELRNTPEAQAAVSRAVRRIRPSTVLSCDPTAWFFGNRYYNHSDHRTAGAVALDGVFPGAGNPHFFADQLRQGLEPWDVPEVRLGWTTQPNHFEDITGFMDVKLAALREHRSQVEGDMLGFFEQWLPVEAEENGKRIGVEHAEAFRQLLLG